MTPDQLRTFLAVARHLNYTHAASALHLSQSAVWRQVRQLERELGSPLVESVGRSLFLTDAGQALKSEAESLLAHHARVEAELRAHEAGSRGRLRVGASGTPGHYLLPRAFGRFAIDHPEVELEYRVANSSAIERALHRNELDIGFVGGVITDTELRAERFAADELVCLVSRRHPLAHERHLLPQRLASEVCVLREEGSSTRRIFEDWLARHGVRLARTIEVVGPDLVTRLVAAGAGFSCTSDAALHESPHRRGLVRLDVEGLDLRRNLRVAWHHGKRSTAIVREFLEYAQDERFA